MKSIHQIVFRIGLCLAVILINPSLLAGNILHVGVAFSYTNIDHAALDAQPGDTILVHEGIYDGGMQIVDLKGTPDNWIVIISAENETAIFEGGTNTQFSDAEYVEINGLIFQGQTGNGLNIDDAGSFDTPTHHIRVIDCIFRNIDATGNNDFLKLSGLDSFLIKNCQFIDGAAGGSGIDMVGCHHGIISDNEFTNLGSNSIQAKGGTQFIRIERNRFENGGLRNINLGGSTGLQFFRPQDAPFEAADLQVYANLFIGGWAGIAYVGSTRVDVANNTFIMPENWVFRILQETVDPSRFVECGDNLFRNNIVYYGDVHRDVNVGPNTRPETFQINNNLWFKVDEPDFSGPDLPVAESNSIYQEDPLFSTSPGNPYRILPHSPAVEAGEEIEELFYDFHKVSYKSPPSIGATEGNILYHTDDFENDNLKVNIYPNPATNYVKLVSTGDEFKFDQIKIYSMSGHLISSFKNKVVDDLTGCTLSIDLPDGNYIVTGIVNNQIFNFGRIIVRND